ncbi:MAG: response regulator [bacterium]|nr:response regulator [bacterium]
MIRILIVDDSNFMRKNLGQLFTQLGHEVVAEAANGIEACDAYEIYKPDLVTMDVTMPKMEGVEAVKKIIAAYPDAKIIMISAQSQKDVVYDAVNAGALTFLAKPIKSENVFKVLNRIFPGETQMDKKKADQYKDIFFTIDLKDDALTITLSGDSKGHPIVSLYKAIGGLVFVSPLNVVFNYEKVEKLPKDILELIVSNFKKIKGAGGTANIISNSSKGG